MKKLFIILFSVLSLLTFGQKKKIALIEPRVGSGSTAVTAMEKAMIRGELRKAIVQFDSYDAITRTDLDQMVKEFGFQSNGMVNESQRKKLGEMFGADYICVSTITKSNTEFYLEAYLIHLESGTMSNTASQYGELVGGKLANMFPACQALAQGLLGEIAPVAHASNYSSTYSKAYSFHQDFTETSYGINMNMVWVEGGEFMMGCTSEQGTNCESDEKGVHRVQVDGYYIGMIEVTQSQWEAVMGTNIYQQRDKYKYNTNIVGRILGNFPIRGVGDDYPIYYVTWKEAMEFCRILSNKTGKTYTLPTEAQWEYAARGGQMAANTKYAGSNLIDAVAWYSDNSGNSTHSCGAKRANALGIYDMSGNVWEWCKDWYSSSYTYETQNPTGPSSGSEHIRRGGGWIDSAFYNRVANRGLGAPSVRSTDTGFRVVCLP